MRSALRRLAFFLAVGLLLALFSYFHGSLPTATSSAIYAVLLLIIMAAIFVLMGNNRRRNGGVNADAARKRLLRDIVQRVLRKNTG